MGWGASQLKSCSRLTISTPTLHAVGGMFPRQGCLYSGCGSAGCQLLVVQCLSGRPYHSPDSVTYLQHVSNQANSTQRLDLSAVEQIQSRHCFGVFSCFCAHHVYRWLDWFLDVVALRHSQIVCREPCSCCIICLLPSLIMLLLCFKDRVRGYKDNTWIRETVGFFFCRDRQCFTLLEVLKYCKVETC